MNKHRAPAQHSLEDIAYVNSAEELLGRARSAAAFARVTGSVASTDSYETRKLDGTLESKPSVTAEAIEVVKHFGPAYRVKLEDNVDTGIVIVLPRNGATSHAA